jgi:hypothetical protein
MKHHNVRRKNSTFNVSIAYSEQHEKDREKMSKQKMSEVFSYKSLAYSYVDKLINI